MENFINLKIEQDKNIKTEIDQFAKNLNLKKACILGAVGSVNDILLTVPINKTLPPKIEKIFIGGPAEILSFSGEIMAKSEMDNQLSKIYKNNDLDYFIHIHASVGITGAKVYGGGFHEGKAFRGLNVFIFCEKINKA
jgi:predicted DNA-binding protein with PD1-like motif